MVALRVFEACEGAVAARDIGTRHEDETSCAADAGDDGVELSVAVEVNHGAGAAGLLKCSFDERAGYATGVRGKDANIFVRVGVFLHGAAEDGFVELGGAIEIGAWNLKPNGSGFRLLFHSAS